MTLLQTVPENVNLKKIENDLVRIAKEEHQTEIKVHNLHVWKLSADKIIGTVHIKIRTLYDQATQVEKFQQVRKNQEVKIYFFRLLVPLGKYSMIMMFII